MMRPSNNRCSASADTQKDSESIAYASICLRGWGDIAVIWGQKSPAGSRGRALVGGLGDEVLTNTSFFVNIKVKYAFW